MNHPDPPKGWTSPRLFRLLIQKPRPTLAIEHRIPGADQFKLSVRSLKSVEVAAAGDGDNAVRCAANLIAASLLADGEPAFDTADQAMLLGGQDFDGLYAAVCEALLIVSPLNSSEWKHWLKEAVIDRGNIQEAISMESCRDVAFGMSEQSITYRPDRYYGIATSDLTDGQLMAFYAACGAINDLRKTDE